MESVVVAAAVAGTISAAGVVVCALFTGLIAFRHRRLEASLKQQVDIEVNRARGEIEHALKTHEARLRVAAEFRMKMLERMLGDVAAFRGGLNAAIGAITLLADEAALNGATAQGHDLLRAARETFATLPSSAPFMPPKLLVAATAFANEFLECLRDVVAWSALEKPARLDRCKATFDRMEEISTRSQALFGTWQTEQFNSFEASLERLDGPATAAALGPRATGA